MPNDSGYSGGPVSLPSGSGAGPANFTPANTADPNGNVTGGVSIWNIPKVLQGHKLWFDNGATTTSDPTLDTRTGKVTTNSRTTTEPQWYYPNRIYNYIFGLAAEADVRGKDGKPTKEAQAALNKYMLIQQALGAGPWGDVHTSGSFDVQTQKALGNALTQYAQEAASGKAQPFTEWLTEQAQKARQYGGYSQNRVSQPNPVSVNLTDPNQIKQAAQAAAMQALGGGLSDDQLNAFVQQFQQQQTQYQTSMQTAKGDMTGTAPDLSAEAAAYAQQADPQAYQQNQHQAYLDALVNLFSGPGATARPTMTPTPKAT